MLWSGLINILLMSRSLLYEPLLGYGEHYRRRGGLGLPQTHAVRTGPVLTRHTSDERDHDKGAALKHACM